MCLKHLHGRTWRGTEGEAEKIAMWKQQQKEGKVLDLTEEVSPEVAEHQDKPKSACNGDVEACHHPVSALSLISYNVIRVNTVLHFRSRLRHCARKVPRLRSKLQEVSLPCCCTNLHLHFQISPNTQRHCPAILTCTILSSSKILSQQRFHTRPYSPKPIILHPLSLP